MYQIHYTNGLTLLTTPRLGKDAARIDDNNGNTIYTGTYDQCVRYLTDRGNTKAKTQNRAHPKTSSTPTPTHGTFVVRIDQGDYLQLRGGFDWGRSTKYAATTFTTIAEATNICRKLKVNNLIRAFENLE